jgi:hypothetical protein
MTAGAFGNAEARRARARQILADQAAARVRYEAERGSSVSVDLDAVRLSLAAQRDRDERDSIRDAMRPDYETSCALAALRRKNKDDAPKNRVELPRQSDNDASPRMAIPARLKPVPAGVVGVGTDEVKALTPEALAKQAKWVRRKMERAEREAIAIQTFIGPRTPSGALVADAIRHAHETTRKACLASLKDVQPVLARYRANMKEEQLREATATFLNESEADTGMEMSADEYAKGINKKTKLKDMARAICHRLNLVGVETKRNDDCGLWVYWIHSGVWEEIDQYRRICINPVVAAASRASILASLEFFIQEHRFCRFWTFTTGTRCTVGEIGERLDTFSRKLSKLNHWMRKTYGVEIVIASTEFGTVEEMDRSPEDEGQIQFVRVLNEKTGLHSDEPTFHPHFHCVVRVIGPRPLPRDEWTELCEKVRARWGFKCDFDGVIQSAREIVKYVTKPGDLLKLSPLQLKAFYEATANRRLVRPMGALRREIAERKTPSDLSAKKTLRRVRVAAGRWEWRERVDINQTLSDTRSKEERAAEDELIDAEVFAQECHAAANAAFSPIEVGETFTLWDDGTKARECAGMTTPEGLPVRLKDKPSFCQVVAYIPPAAGPTRRKENRVIVMGNIRCVDTVNKHPLVMTLRARTQTAWYAGEALAGANAAFADCAAISVHTGTVTVPDELQTPAGWRLDDPIQLVFETA